MKYVMLFTVLALSTSAIAADKKTAQQKTWTDEYQYGAKEKESAPKTGKPSEGGEFEVAPKE
jgi:hypothetical protein